MLYYSLINIFTSFFLVFPFFLVTNLHAKKKILLSESYVPKKKLFCCFENLCAKKKTRSPSKKNSRGPLPKKKPGPVPGFTPPSIWGPGLSPGDLSPVWGPGLSPGERPPPKKTAWPGGFHCLPERKDSSRSPPSGKTDPPFRREHLEGRKPTEVGKGGVFI